MLLLVGVAYILGVIWTYRFTRAAEVVVAVRRPDLKWQVKVLSALARACFPGFALLWAIPPFVGLDVPYYVLAIFGVLGIPPLILLNVLYTRAKRGEPEPVSSPRIVARAAKGLNNPRVKQGKRKGKKSAR